jgi:DNA primase
MLDLKSELNKIDISNYIPIDKKKPCNTKGTYTIKTCPFCHSKSGNHFWVWKHRYGSYSGCCKGGTLWDFYMEYEGMSQSDARKKCIEVLNLSSIGTDFSPKYLKMNKKLDLIYIEMMQETVKNMVEKLEKLLKIHINLDINDSIYMELLLNLEQKRSLNDRYNYVLYLQEVYLI